MVGDHMGILGAVVLNCFPPTNCNPPFPRPLPAPRLPSTPPISFFPSPFGLNPAPVALVCGGVHRKFGKVPLKRKKRELVVSRFTLLGRSSPVAGKNGTFLLHGG